MLVPNSAWVAFWGSAKGTLVWGNIQWAHLAKFIYFPVSTVYTYITMCDLTVKEGTEPESHGGRMREDKQHVVQDLTAVLSACTYLLTMIPRTIGSKQVIQMYYMNFYTHKDLRTTTASSCSSHLLRSYIKLFQYASDFSQYREQGQFKWFSNWRWKRIIEIFLNYICPDTPVFCKILWRSMEGELCLEFLYSEGGVS